MTDQDIAAIIRAKQMMDDAPVPTDHRMMIDPLTGDVICDHGRNAHEGDHV